MELPKTVQIRPVKFLRGILEPGSYTLKEMNELDTLLNKLKPKQKAEAQTRADAFTPEVQ